MALRSLSVFDHWAQNASITPQAPALEWPEGHMTCTQLIKESRAVAAGLQDLGIQFGDRVAVMARNLPHFFPLLGAASLIGAVLVLINRRLSPEEIKVILDDTTPQIMIYEHVQQDLVNTVIDQRSSVRTRIVLGESQNGEMTYADLLQADLAYPALVPSHAPYVIIHTAAVQGRPRGAVLSQENLLLASLQLAYAFHLTTQDACLNVLPLYHIMGLNLALAASLGRGKNVLLPQFDPVQAAQLIADQRATFYGSFPPILAQIMQAIEDGKTDTSSLRHVIGLENPETVGKWEALTGSTFWAMYGQTETSGLITFAPLTEHPGGAGRPGQLSSISIQNEAGNDLPAGETGEIVLHGPLVFLGYWNQDEVNAYTFRHGWHHTGDLGQIDENGHLIFQGRKAEKELIKSGGENVFPAEVEQVILQHPEVTEACVIGVSDPKFGEGIKAICVCQESKGVDDKSLIQFVGSRIAGYKKPRWVEFVDQLPKTKDGDIDRNQVKSTYGNI
ncbi:MAG: AMP-binding protein [Desulfovermiculus sp.]